MPVRAAVPDTTAAVFQAKVAPVLEQYCTDCHGAKMQKAKVNLAGARTAEQLSSNGGDVWFRVLDQLESRKMPPEAEDQPSATERAAVTAWIRRELTSDLLAKQRLEGRSKLRRLTRTEYANTCEDLFGVRPNVDLNLPTDGLVDGYDKVSSALALSSEGAQGYLKMADDLLRWFSKGPSKNEPGTGADEAGRTVRAPAIESGESPGHSLVLEDGTIVSFNTDVTSGRLKFPGVKTPGRHKVRLSVYAYQSDRPLPFGVYVGNTNAYPQQLELAEIMEAPPGKATVLETELDLREGMGLRLIPFGLGVPVPKNTKAAGFPGPGLAVQWVETIAPPLPLRIQPLLLADCPPALLTEWRGNPNVRFSKDPKKGSQAKSVTREEYHEIMRKTFERMGTRLYRRELTPAEVASYADDVMRQVEDEEVPLQAAFLATMQELLTAPEFLCVVETPGVLNDFALASRLSYFLWNSTPDETLLRLAKEGRLHEPKVLDEQTERLLNDPKCERFIADFTDQWLGLRAIAETSPDSKLYPGYDELLRFSSVRETRGFLRALIAGNQGVRQFVGAPWAMLNQPLAAHYGVPGVSGLGLRKVDLPTGSPFGGFWTQSAIMKVTANGTNTSPVKRGVWVSERLLGIHIPPPPPNITPLEPNIRGAKTLREQLTLHSQSASCAACHARFDPYGFALESFDVTGAFRVNYRVPNPEFARLSPTQRKGREPWRDGLPVECAGRTPDGQQFAGIAELRAWLASHPEQLAVGFMRHLVTYATGTPPGPIDEAAIKEIVEPAAGAGYPVRTLIHRLVQSSLFRSK